MKQLKTKTEPSFHADIYVAGNKPKIRQICHEWVKRGACVSVFDCEYIYTGKTYKNGYVEGCENGYLVRMIQYPRFPSPPEEIEKNAIELAKAFIRSDDSILSASVVCHPSGNTTFIYDEHKEI